MAHMLAVAAFQLRHPVTKFILVKPGDFALHKQRAHTSRRRRARCTAMKYPAAP